MTFSGFYDFGSGFLSQLNWQKYNCGYYVQVCFSYKFLPLCMYYLVMFHIEVLLLQSHHEIKLSYNMLALYTLNTNLELALG